MLLEVRLIIRLPDTSLCISLGTMAKQLCVDLS